MAKKLSPFEEAFKEARAEGKKTFTFNGKSYGTVTADDEQKRIDKLESKSRQSGPVTTTQGATYPKPAAPAPKEEAPKPRARSLVDQGRGVQLYKDVDKEAVLNAGLGLASVFPAVAGTRMAYTAARPAIGAAARYFSKKDSPAASVADDIKEPAFNPEKMVDRSRSEPAFNPDKMVDRRSTTFPGRSEPKFNPDKMTGRDRPEPEGPPLQPPREFEFFKKGGKVFSEQTRKQQKAADLGKKMASGGKVSSASSRGDGIAQRGKTKGRVC